MVYRTPQQPVEALEVARGVAEHLDGWSAQHDPVHPDPVHPDPVHPDPVHTDPVHTDPVHTDPVHPDLVYLAGGDDRRIRVQVDGWRRANRVTFTGVLVGDHTDRHGIRSAEITVAKTRPFSQMSAEITRRLLPTYQTSLAEARRRVGLRMGRQHALEQATADLVAAFPQLRHGQDGAHLWTEDVDIHIYAWIDSRAGNGNCPDATLKLSGLDLATARAVLGLCLPDRD